MKWKTKLCSFFSSLFEKRHAIRMSIIMFGDRHYCILMNYNDSCQYNIKQNANYVDVVIVFLKNFRKRIRKYET